ncbi:hypothetical protein GPALN_014129 [Globodera pallida]|nr:hypothetical protein GPALN_014129 [Globodera pallida]
MTVELAGFMGLAGVKLNPISAVTLITAVGIGVEFTAHVALAFLTSLGTLEERMVQCLQHMFVPVIHAGMFTLLLWRKFLPLLTIFVLCAPILTCLPVFKMNPIIQLNNPNSTTDRNFVLFEAGDAPSIKYITLNCAVFSAIFMIICVLINICTFVAYKLRVKKVVTNGNSVYNIEQKLLVYAIATFLGHALVASLYLILIISNIDDPKTKAMLYVYYPMVIDTGDKN